MRVEYRESFEAFVQEVMRTYKGQGIGIIGFDRDNLEYQYFYGYKDVETQSPIDLNTIFGIASISKSFTNIGLMKLVEKNKINLEDKVDQYIPELKLPESQMPKIKHLLSHTAGFWPQERFLMNDLAHALEFPDNLELAGNTTLSQKGLEMVVNRLNQALSFNGEPGKYHSYCNFSYGLITSIIERLSDEKSYVEYMMNEVIGPLGLDRTFFDFQKTKKVDNISKLYENVLGHLNTLDDYTDQGFVLLGGGAIKSTLNNLMTYTRLYLNGGKHEGKPFISEALLEEMSKPYVQYKPFEAYGFGLINGKFDGIAYAGHSGGLTGVSSFFGFTKETGKGIVVLCNTSNVPVTAIGLAALKMMNDKLPDWKMQSFDPITWTLEEIEKTLGVYKSDEGANIEIRADGTSGISWWQGQEEMPVTLVSADAVLVYNKMIWSYTPIIRDEKGYARAVYSGSRLIPKK